MKEEAMPEETPKNEEGKPLQDAALKILDGLATKGLEEVKDEKVRGYLTEVWGDLHKEIPDLFKVLVGDGETVLSGKYEESTKAIMKKIQDDLLTFRAGGMDAIDFEEIVRIRRAAIFALYNAQRVSQAQPSLQHVLSAAESIATILITKAVPFILALL
jgi:hypothetical protein